MPRVKWPSVQRFLKAGEGHLTEKITLLTTEKKNPTAADYASITTIIILIFIMKRYPSGAVSFAGTLMELANVQLHLHIVMI